MPQDRLRGEHGIRSRLGRSTCKSPRLTDTSPGLGMPRNEGVRGSSPRVGSFESPAVSRFLLAGLASRFGRRPMERFGSLARDAVAAGRRPPRLSAAKA
jgi:hypothetical protein